VTKNMEENNGLVERKQRFSSRERDSVRNGKIGHKRTCTGRELSHKRPACRKGLIRGKKDSPESFIGVKKCVKRKKENGEAKRGVISTRKKEYLEEKRRVGGQRDKQ